MHEVGLYPGMTKNDKERFDFLLFVVYYIHCLVGANVLDRSKNAKYKPINDELKKAISFLCPGALYLKNGEKSKRVKNSLEELLEGIYPGTSELIVDNIKRLSKSSIKMALDIASLDFSDSMISPYACKFIGFEVISLYLYKNAGQLIEEKVDNKVGVNCGSYGNELYDCENPIRNFIFYSSGCYLYGHEKRLTDAKKAEYTEKSKEDLMATFNNYHDGERSIDTYLEGMSLCSFDDLIEGNSSDFICLDKITTSDSYRYSDLALFSKVLSISKCENEVKDINHESYIKFLTERENRLHEANDEVVSKGIKRQLEAFRSCLNGNKYNVRGRSAADPTE